tara:strand:+ start:1573 stop:1815 length:243 start_codon:yes stop_codon:yes gene_type:complete
MPKQKKIIEEPEPEEEEEEEDDEDDEEEMDLAHLFHHFFTNEDGTNIADVLTQMSKSIDLHNQLLQKLLQNNKSEPKLNE